MAIGLYNSLYYRIQAVITYTHGLVCQVVTADPFIQIILR